jgi:cytoskeleton protein RodZ
VDEGVGPKLREARTRRRLSLAEVEAETKIRGRYLQAIENEDWDQLPGDIYARAFIRTYGGFLGIDGERLAEEQRRQRGAARPGERLPRVDPRPRRVARGRSARRAVSPRLIAVLVSALVAAALLALGLATGDGGEEAPPRSGAEKPKARQAAPAGPRIGTAVPVR